MNMQISAGTVARWAGSVRRGGRARSGGRPTRRTASTPTTGWSRPAPPGPTDRRPTADWRQLSLSARNVAQGDAVRPQPAANVPKRGPRSSNSCRRLTGPPCKTPYLIAVIACDSIVFDKWVFKGKILEIGVAKMRRKYFI